jgi:tetratricopeptide (TPR) repeat protein
VGWFTTLGDSRESPRFIETAPRRGYRFIAPVDAVQTEVAGQAVPAAGMPGVAAAVAAPSAPVAMAPAAAAATTKWRKLLVTSAVVMFALATLGVLFLNRPAAPGVVGATAQVPQRINAEARTAYAKGRHFFDLGTRDGYRKSCDYFQLALNADPSQALVYRGMADCYMAMSSAGLATPEQMMPKARGMALKAIELDPSLAEAHAALGSIRLNYDWDWPGAFVELEKAVQLAPANLNNRYALSSYYRVVGQVDDVVRELKVIESLDPASPKGYERLGWLYVWAGRYREGVEELRKCIELSPYDSIGHFGLFLAYDHLARPADAMEELQQYLSLQKETDILARVSRTYLSAGYEKARRQYFELITASFVERHFLSYQIAGGYAMLGQKERALAYLEQAYRERSNHMNHLKVDSYFDNLRDEPRFRKLMELMKLTDEQLTAAAQLTASTRR